MRSIIVPIVAGAALLAATAAVQAKPVLIAKAEITATTAGANADLSGLSGNLENGLPANILGGIGSGIAYDGAGNILALPDRGPNATPFDSKIDDTVTFIPRFDSIAVTLAPSASGAALPFTLDAKVTGTTLLWSPTALKYGSGEGLDVPNGAPAQNQDGKYYFTGRSDAVDSSQSTCDSDDARMDTESIRLSNDGKDVFISDEYGPYLYEFDRATGKRLRAFTLPPNLCAARPLPTVDAEVKGNTSGRTTNKGMEGLAITPDGKTLVGVIQAALLQDAADKATKKLIRLVTVDIASGETHEYGYMLTDGSGVSEIIAINDHEFMLDERDGNGMGDGGTAKVKEFFRIDLDGAKDITGLTGQDAASAAVKKTKWFDFVAAMGAIGVDADHVPSKIEGLAFGPDVTMNGQTVHTLFVSNDNDFLPQKAGPNQLFVVGFTDADLPGYMTPAAAD